MKVLLITLSLVMLAIIIYQDFKFNAVSWYIFPMLMIASFFYGRSMAVTPLYYYYILINFGIILIQILILTLYYLVRDKKVQLIAGTKIGLGDILFFVVLGLIFSPIWFILFLTTGMIITVLVHLIRTGKEKKAYRKIPLAGYLALIYLVFFILNNFVLHLDLFDIDILNL